MWLLLLWISLSVVVGFLGRDRVLGFWGFFIASLILSPIVVLIVLLVTKPRARASVVAGNH